MKLDTKQTKETPKKITLEDLIKRAAEPAHKKATANLYVDSLKGTITIKEPDEATCMDALNMGGDKGNDYIIYHCVVEPNLKDADLRKAFGVVEPLEIVRKIFPKAGERAAISQICVEMAGFGDSVKVIEEIKNE